MFEQNLVVQPRGDLLWAALSFTLECVVIGSAVLLSMMHFEPLKLSAPQPIGILRRPLVFPFMQLIRCPGPFKRPRTTRAFTYPTRVSVEPETIKGLPAVDSYAALENSALADAVLIAPPERLSAT